MPHIIEDAAVPLENLPKLFRVITKINKNYKTKAIVYGHIGNGNLHVRLISDRQDLDLVREIAADYFEEIIKIDGTITAEHGDGLARSEFIKKQYGVINYRIFKEIKQFFDPENTLNPGKIITKKNSITKNLKF